MTPKINLHRLTECDLCERPAPTKGNARQYGDERDRAALCARCERQIRVEVDHYRLVQGLA